MKLVYAIVNNDDNYAVSKALLKKGHTRYEACIYGWISLGGQHYFYDLLPRRGR